MAAARSKWITLTGLKKITKGRSWPASDGKRKNQRKEEGKSPLFLHRCKEDFNMTCPKCGAKLVSGTAVCPICGSKQKPFSASSGNGRASSRKNTKASSSSGRQASHSSGRVKPVRGNEDDYDEYYDTPDDGYDDYDDRYNDRYDDRHIDYEDDVEDDDYGYEDDYGSYDNYDDDDYDEPVRKKNSGRKKKKGSRKGLLIAGIVTGVILLGVIIALVIMLLQSRDNNLYKQLPETLAQQENQTQAANTPVIPQNTEAARVPEEQTAEADDKKQIKVDGNIYEKNGNGVTLVEYNGTSSIATLPSEVSGYKVTAIGQHAFAKSKNVQYLKLPENVTSLDTYYMTCRI